MLVFLIGALLVPGARTVAAVLRVMDCLHRRHWPTEHRVLNRARWSNRQLRRLRRGLLRAACGPPRLRSSAAGVTTVSVVAARRPRPRAATGTRCAPARGSSSRSAASVGCPGHAWSPYPGHSGGGPCPCSRCWPPRTLLSCGPRPPSWACMRWSPSLRITCSRAHRARSAPQPGIPRSSPPAALPWRWRAGNARAKEQDVPPGPRRHPTGANSQHGFRATHRGPHLGQLFG
ncbi:MAG: transposase [Chloroflexi bacterium]|nr:transposase [Chloroflexota bacterium]